MADERAYSSARGEETDRIGGGALRHLNRVALPFGVARLIWALGHRRHKLRVQVNEVVEPIRNWMNGLVTEKRCVDPQFPSCLVLCVKGFCPPV
jgi:hypothetical protein